MLVYWLEKGCIEADYAVINLPELPNAKVTLLKIALNPYRLTKIQQLWKNRIRVQDKIKQNRGKNPSYDGKSIWQCGL